MSEPDAELVRLLPILTNLAVDEDVFCSYPVKRIAQYATAYQNIINYVQSITDERDALLSRVDKFLDKYDSLTKNGSE